MLDEALTYIAKDSPGASGDTDLPRIRFLMDPEIPVVTGTRRIR